MTGLKQRIFRRRAPGSPRRSAAGPAARLKAGVSRLRPAGLLSRLRPGGRSRTPWGKRAGAQRVLQPGDPSAAGSATDGAAAAGYSSSAVATAEVVETAPGSASFRDRGRLRRRLRFLRRARELAFRDVGGLIFDMRRFGRDRPDLVDAKLGALAAVDQELRALERVLDDRRPIHELREPGLSSCPRCGALHASEDNFCPRCGLQFGGARAMGEVGGAIAAPPQPPPAPIEQPTSPTLVVPGSGLEQAGAYSGAPPARAATAAPGSPASAPAQTSTAAPGSPASAPAQTSTAEPESSAPTSTATPQPPAPAPASAPSDETPARPSDTEHQTEIYRPHDAS
jgi:hypothetical protein